MRFRVYPRGLEHEGWWAEDFDPKGKGELYEGRLVRLRNGRPATVIRMRDDDSALIVDEVRGLCANPKCDQEDIEPPDPLLPLESEAQPRGVDYATCPKCGAKLRRPQATPGPTVYAWRLRS